jgi:multiple antibiotic resistance protein
MITMLIPAFVTLFVIIDPIGLVPIFAVLTAKGDHSYRRDMAFKGVLVASAVLFLSALLGETILKVFGISMPAFRIAGGLLLFLVSVEMIMEYRSVRRTGMADKRVAEEQGRLEDVSAFPLAIPFIAGPGSITTVILITSAHPGNWRMEAAILGILVVIMALCYVLLRLSEKIMALLGTTVTGVLSRLLGVITAAISVQFIIDGVRAVMSGF